VGLHAFRPLGDLRRALLRRQRLQLARVKRLSAAPAGQVLAVEEGRKAFRRFYFRRAERGVLASAASRRPDRQNQ